MSEKPEKLYIPKSSAKIQKTSFGEIIKIGINIKSLGEFIRQNVTGEYLNIDIVPRREVKEDGVTHSLVLNTWKPDFNKARESVQQPESAPKKTINEPKPDTGDDVPF
jgi:hypothetical protein